MERWVVRRRALAAAFLLGDLHQQNLTPLDHLLDAVAALQNGGVHGGFGAFPLVVAGPARQTPASPPGGRGRRGGGWRAFVARLVAVVVRLIAARLIAARLVAVVAAGGTRLIVFARGLVGPFVSPFVGLIVVPFGGQAVLRHQAGLFGGQLFPVGRGNLEVIGVDLAEGQEAVAVAAVIDERRLQRRLHPDHLGQIDIALELGLQGEFDVEFLKVTSIGDHHAGFFPLAGVDQHAFGHEESMVGGERAGRRCPGVATAIAPALSRLCGPPPCLGPPRRAHRAGRGPGRRKGGVRRSRRSLFGRRWRRGLPKGIVRDSIARCEHHDFQGHSASYESNGSTAGPS